MRFRRRFRIEINATRACNSVGFITPPMRLARRRLQDGSQDNDDGKRPQSYRSARLFARRGRAEVKALIDRNLDAVGRTAETELTAFTDGCSGLRRILADAGVTDLPFLDWFHIGMRLQHLKQVAGALSCDDPSREAEKAVNVGEVERLHWRLWNGKPPMLGSASIASMWSCIISKVSRVRESRSRHRESCGPPCIRLTAI
jgi:hypothetical protein